MNPLRVQVAAPAGTLAELGTIDGWQGLGDGWFLVSCPEWRDDVADAFGARVLHVEAAGDEAMANESKCCMCGEPVSGLWLGMPRTLCEECRAGLEDCAAAGPDEPVYLVEAQRGTTGDDQ